VVADLKPRLGEQLVAAEVIDQESLSKGLALQELKGGLLIDVLVENRLVDERKLLRFLAETSGARYITADKLAKANPAISTLDKIPARHAEKLSVLPLSFYEPTNTLTLAISEIDEGLVEQVRLAAGAAAIVPVIATRMAIRAAIKRYYYGDTYAFAQMDESEAPAKLQEEPPGKVLAREEPSRVCASPSEPPPAELDALHREMRLLRLASELQRHLSGERDANAILHRVLAFAFDNLPADNGALIVVDPATRKLFPKGVRTRSGESAEVVISETLVREVIGSRQGVLTGDALADSRFSGAESVIGASVRSAMGVPVIVGGEVRAVVFLDTRERTDVFTDQDLTALMAIAAQAALALESLDLSRQMASEMVTRAHLARFFSPDLVEQAASGKLNLSGVAEAQEATILVADIRGFGSFSERHPPREVVAALNEHFTHMAEIVFSNGGVLDKFIGDAVIGLWGVPLARPDAPAKALRCALEMLERLGDMNALREISGKEKLQLGIGICTGPVVFGAIGAPKRMELTAIGDAVSTAARLCEMAEPGQIVACESTIGAAGQDFVCLPLPPASLKGKSQPIEVFSVVEEHRSE
jgi:adenylate cyclase